MKTVIISILSILMIFIAGCGKDKAVDPDPTQAMAVNLTMAEKVEGNDRELVFYIATDQIFGCCNNLIQNEVLRQDNLVNIYFDGIYFPDICLTALGPATAEISMGDLAPGNYMIYLNNGSLSNFVLKVTAESYTIEPIKIVNLTIKNSFLPRE